MHDYVTTANFGIILSPLREALITFQLLPIRLLLTSTYPGALSMGSVIGVYMLV